MQITINNEQIDFTLEEERILGDVVDGIQDWLVSNGFTITSIRRDETELSFATRLEWQNDPVDEIGLLDITARHPMDLAYDKMSAAAEYLKLIEEDGRPDSPLIADLLKGADDVAEMIDDVIPQVGETTFGLQFRELAEKTGLIADGDVSTPDFSRFLNFVSDLVLVLSSRMHEISDPESELKTIVPALKDLLAETGNIAVLLQTGKDREALSRLIRLIEVLQKLIRVVHLLNDQALLNLGIVEIDGAKISEFSTGLNGFLRELSEAMENGDSILIGDLLEYEITPRIGSFIEALERSGVL